MTDTGTTAVHFDPFAEDDDEPDIDISALLKEVEDPSARSRRQALSTFRERRNTQRTGRSVADGMVTLPFVSIVEPESRLKDPDTDFNLGTPKLKPGDIVGNQYEILGVIAHGGMGWVYLAHDRNVSGRTVVLKGMQETASEHDRAAATAEREFLADMTHPGIVKIYNFIDDPRQEGGFIVMEYVGGPSLRDRARDYEGGVLPVDLAIGYILDVLQAMEYLHSRGVVYNDLKPDNIILTEDQVKLIDMGAVTGIGAFGYIYGTKGFQAPEVATEGPSVASDIYTIGRTLASLTVRLDVVDGAYSAELPDPLDEPLFRHYLSFFRFLRRATHPNPALRFSSVAELRTQLYGVLREILAIRDDRQFPARHSLLSPQRSTFGTKHMVFRTDQLLDGIQREAQLTAAEIVPALSVPLPDSTDVAASMMSGTSYVEPQETLQTLMQAMPAYQGSVEIPLGIVRSMLDVGMPEKAREWLEKLRPSIGHDWRFHWYYGVVDLMMDDSAEAQRHFNKVFAILPGESAPKLALAAVSELIQQQDGYATQPLLNDATVHAAALLDSNLHNLDRETFADLTRWSYTTRDPEILRFHTIRLYGLVWRTNPTTVSSAFGLARMLMAEGQVEMAVRALDKVSVASKHHRLAQLTTIIQLISATLTEPRIRRAARRLEEIPTNESRFWQMKIAVISAGLNYLREHHLNQAAANTNLFEYPFTQLGLRTGLSENLRILARQSPFARHRYELIDMANQVRPVTWF